ncbi:hypothetical protein SD77_1155 [Bacillus badius]|uniref:Uncharacterized protein n=1 Tax=Bacillus badius TaxID=1455 RepID=A0ABR5ASU9_BACBA|nr:hypothetical protein SD77_1155 [Bacillus badius]
MNGERIIFNKRKLLKKMIEASAECAAAGRFFQEPFLFPGMNEKEINTK